MFQALRDQWNLPTLSLGPTYEPGPQLPYTPSPTALSVNRKLQITIVDKYSGAQAAGHVYIYDGKTLLEDLTLSSGTISSGDYYRSGTVLNFKWVETDTYNYMWYTNLEIPKMEPGDIEAVANNPLTFKSFTDVGTAVVMSIRDGDGNAYTDTGNLNITSGGTPGKASGITLTISWFVPTDDTGFISSKDPIYDIDLHCILYCKVYGTNYEYISMEGWQSSYSKGTSTYYVYEIPDSAITKDKVGNTYVLPGTGSITVTLEASGYTGTAADLEFVIQTNANINYHINKGDWGPMDRGIVTGTPFTINMIV